MSYEFHTLYSTDTAFNCDVKKSGDEGYMGRLYVFPTEDPALLKLGIEKEWFLAHESGDYVVCGHINTEGQWCLSFYQSLEPSLEYTTQIEVFDRVFSPQYMEEVLVRRSSEQSLESFEYVAPSANGAGGGDASNGGQPARFDPRLITDFSASIPNLDVLLDLLLRSPLEDLQEHLKVTDVQGEALEDEAVNSVTAIIPPEVVEDASTKLDDERLMVQDALVEKILGEYLERDTSEFVLPPFGAVTIHIEEDYFVLRDDDGCTIIAATLEGEIIDELQLTDVRRSADILKQAEIEAFHLETLQLHDVETNGGEEVAAYPIQSKGKKSKGVEHGS